MEQQQHPSMKRRRTDDDEGELNSFVTELQKIMNVKMDTPGGKVFRRHCVMVHEENRRVEKEGGVAREVVTPLSLAVLKEMGFGGQDERDLMKQAERKVVKIKTIPKIFDFDENDTWGKNAPTLQKISEVLSSWYQLQKLVPTTTLPLFEKMPDNPLLKVRKIYMLNTEQLITFLIDGTTQQVRDVRADVARLMTVIFTQTDRFFYSTLKKVYADLMEADKRASEADLRAELESARADKAELQTKLESERADKAELQVILESERADQEESQNRVLRLENMIAKYNRVMTNEKTDNYLFITRIEPYNPGPAKVVMYCNKSEAEHVKQLKEYVGPNQILRIVLQSKKLPEAPGLRDIIFTEFSKRYGTKRLTRVDRKLTYVYHESVFKHKAPFAWDRDDLRNYYRVVVHNGQNESDIDDDVLIQNLVKEIRKKVCGFMLRKVFDGEEDPVFPGEG
ncbi:ORF109 [Haliotid herpesvirus 1]|nr:ORF59 [Haliotid herpesvirus 1]UCX57100.1 ORF109 [Haliotid herpesvirus 1]